MNLLIPILCQIGAFLIGLAEVIIPSMGILTVIAVILFGYSWYYIITALQTGTFFFFIIGDLILIPIFIQLSLILIRKSPLSLKNQLEKGDGLQTTNTSNKNFIGQIGIVESPLRPTGKAYFESDLREVVSDNSFIDEGKKVRIIDIVGNKITVEEITLPPKGESHAS